MRIEERVKQFKKKQDLIQKFQGEKKPMRDAAGVELKPGDLVHIPTNAIPAPVIMGEVQAVLEAGVLKIPGQPPMPARIVIVNTLMLGPGPDGVVPFLYKVGERPRPQQKEEEPAKTIDGLASEDPMDTATHTDTPLASEAPPEGIELTDV